MPGEDWDWSQHVVDHLELHASDYGASVSFYATVLTPLDIPNWSEDWGGERATCFTRVSVVDRQPPTRGLHLCFVARSPALKPRWLRARDRADESCCRASGEGKRGGQVLRCRRPRWMLQCKT